MMKKIISQETLLAYPDLTKPFIIHTDTSHTQHSHKLNPAQTQYTATKSEWLAIIKTLKEF